MNGFAAKHGEAARENGGAQRAMTLACVVHHQSRPVIRFRCLHAPSRATATFMRNLRMRLRSKAPEAARRPPPGWRPQNKTTQAATKLGNKKRSPLPLKAHPRRVRPAEIQRRLCLRAIARRSRRSRLREHWKIAPRQVAGHPNHPRKTQCRSMFSQQRQPPIPRHSCLLLR